MATPYTPNTPSTPSNELPSYAAHRISQSYNLNAPPAPPPKPGIEEASRQSTPAAGHPAFSTPPTLLADLMRDSPALDSHRYQHQNQNQNHQAGMRDAGPMPRDPGDRWLPKLLEDKSKQELAEMLKRPEILSALVHSRRTAHPSTMASQEPLLEALEENVSLASHLNDLETRLAQLRASTQAQLLSAHALERQWRQKQSEMDRALSPFSPSSLYQRLNQGVQEQEMICRALEESFLDGDGGLAPEREIAEWVRRYREAKKLYYLRRERKERWDEGRVGGWR